jgi:hypothetical protein
MVASTKVIGRTVNNMGSESTLQLQARPREESGLKARELPGSTESGEVNK